MILDLTSLAGLTRTELKEGGHVVKFLEVKGDQPIPPHSRLWLSFQKYNFKGELLSQQKSIIYKESDNSKHSYPASFGMCLSSMKKGETSWFRFSGLQAHGSQSEMAEGVYYHLSIEKFKVLTLSNSALEDRMQSYRENKKLAKEYFQKEDYRNALDFYETCKNSYTSIPGKRDIPEEIKSEIASEVTICNRNMALCALKGKMTEEYEKYKTVLQKELQKDPNNAKSLYLLGKLQLAMKYTSLGKQTLIKSYKLIPNESVLAEIKQLDKKETNQKFVFQSMLKNFQDFNEKEQTQQLRRERRQQLKKPEIDEKEPSESWLDEDIDELIDDSEEEIIT